MTRPTWFAAVVAIVFMAGAAQRPPNAQFLGPISIYADANQSNPTIRIDPTQRVFQSGSGSTVPSNAITFADSGALTIDGALTLGTSVTLNGSVVTGPSAAATIGDDSVSWAQGGVVANALDTQFFIADRIYTVTGINVVWGVAESTGAMDVMVERLQGTEACAAGDNLQVAVVDATGTANTVTSPALTATTALLTLAAGDRLCVDLTATPNEVTNLVVTVSLEVS